MRLSASFRVQLLQGATIMSLTVTLAGHALGMDAGEAGRRLAAAYPEAIERIDGNVLVFRDGTKLVIDDGKPPKTPEEILADPDLDDIFAWDYPAGAQPAAPPELADPGRARPHALFAKLYGDCTRGEAEPHFVDVVWLPNKAGQKLRMTSRHGAAAALARVSTELDGFPPSFDVYLRPSAGTYNCRTIAGTGRPSAHGYGIAIDISIEKADYWRWSDKGTSGAAQWRNRIPMEIVTVFERHGFIWGGRWHHYDTMHFEYRPELLPSRSD